MNPLNSESQPAIGDAVHLESLRKVYRSAEKSLLWWDRGTFFDDCSARLNNGNRLGGDLFDS